MEIALHTPTKKVSEKGVRFISLGQQFGLRNGLPGRSAAR
jgi:hypothetical protein